MKDFIKLISTWATPAIVSLFLLVWVFFWPTDAGKPSLFNMSLRLIPILILLDLIWVFTFIN